MQVLVATSQPCAPEHVCTTLSLQSITECKSLEQPSAHAPPSPKVASGKVKPPSLPVWPPSATVASLPASPKRLALLEPHENVNPDATTMHPKQARSDLDML